MKPSQRGPATERGRLHPVFREALPVCAVAEVHILTATTTTASALLVGPLALSPLLSGVVLLATIGRVGVGRGRRHGRAKPTAAHTARLVEIVEPPAAAKTSIEASSEIDHLGFFGGFLFALFASAFAGGSGGFVEGGAEPICRQAAVLTSFLVRSVRGSALVAVAVAVTVTVRQTPAESWRRAVNGRRRQPRPPAAPVAVKPLPAELDVVTTAPQPTALNHFVSVPCATPCGREESGVHAPPLRLCPGAEGGPLGGRGRCQTGTVGCDGACV
mmetsp:Transcript_21362/g.52245  ORF Transcript_21362/g.52245 Transcript_21362/m.52245 type:complete len:273 (+) Transcript_21362:922-1740(+)